MNSETYLGFDYGVKKIGVATGQSILMTTSPLQTIRAVKEKTNWPVISELIEIWQPVALVVGISTHADGSDNLVTQSMHRFCRQLDGRYRLPVHTVDETLTTFAAKQMLFDELGLTQAKLMQVQDQVAAQLILQTWFEGSGVGH